MILKTRKDYADLLKKTTEPLRPLYSKGGARLKIIKNGASYTLQGQEYEGCMRVLWGLIPLWTDEDKDFFANIYKTTFEFGTDPASDEYWGNNMRDNDERFVEYAVIGTALLLCPEKILGNLDETGLKNFLSYVNLINEKTVCGNNWLFFRILLNSGLIKNGLMTEKSDFIKSMIETDFKRIEGFYLGNGWYFDGNSSQRDYYIAFAFHYYSLIYAKTMEDFDPKRCKLFKERATEFAKDFIYYFDKSGAAVSFGRSQTYRFAQISFFSALVFADVEAFDWGIIKGIINRNLRYFYNLNIFDNSGVVTVGYGYPNINMSEEYNGSGAPYWAYKSFILLAQNKNHPYFECEEKEYPSLLPVKEIKEGLTLIQKTDTDTVLFPVGHYACFEPAHVAQKYAKFAYSAQFGFSVPRADDCLWREVPDNMLSFEYFGKLFVRKTSLVYKIDNNRVYSEWSPFEGISVITEIIPEKNGHICRNTVESNVECTAYEGGFCIPYKDEAEIRQEKDSSSIKITSYYGTSAISLLQGNGEPFYITCAPNTNLILPVTALPTIKYNIKPGKYQFETFVSAEIK